MIQGARSQPVARQPGAGATQCLNRCSFLVSRSWRVRRMAASQPAFRPSSRHPSARRGKGPVPRVRASYEPFHWKEDDYYEAALQLVQGTLDGGAQGFLLLMRVDAGGELVDEEKGLVLAVGGDTMRSISQATQHKGPHDRPLALDLLWSILERGREISKRDWQLVRVAIVELRGSVFIGRLFFGDPASGRVVWDCDSRPSDSIWLALKAKCPLFVNKEVWAENATSLKEIRGDAQGGPPTDILQSPEGAEGAGAAERRRGGWRSKSVSPGRGSRAGPPPGAGGAQEAAAEEASALMTRIRPTDPEPLKRLKMEMRVALKEEDYGAAARIRDHPFMRMHIRILDHLKAGRQSEASDLEARLHDAVERYERSGGTEIMQFEE